MFELTQSFIDKYRSLNSPNYKLSKEGKVIEKKINYLYGRRLLLPANKIRLLSILLQHINLDIFTNEELEAVGKLDIQHLLNDSNEIINIDLSLTDYIFYEDVDLKHITKKDLNDKLAIDLLDIDEQYCKQKTSIDNFIVRLS
jgi:hypothetical protein